MDYDQQYDEALFRADEERERGDAERGGCSGVDPFEDDSDEELDVEDADEDVAEEEDPSEEEDDDIHAEEAPVEAEPIDAPAEPVPVEVPHEIVPVDVPLEIVPVRAPAEPAPIEAPAGNEGIWIDIEMDPRSVVPESPPISPIALWGPAAPISPIVEVIGHPPVTPPESPLGEMYSDDEPEMGGPIDDEDSDERTISDPDLPTSPPVPVMTVYEHDLILAHSTAELVVAHARIDELRMQLDAVEQERLQAQRRQRWRDFRVHRALGAVRRIERRALDRLRSVSLHRGRRHFREAAARVIARAMRRVRRTIRGG